MNIPARRTLKTFGVLLLFALPLCFVGAGAYSYFAPRVYSATTHFQLLHPAEDGPLLDRAFQEAKKEFSSVMTEPMPSNVFLKETGAPAEFEITAFDTDPSCTRDSANTLALLIKQSLQAAHQEDSPRVKIVQPAEASLYPSFPNVKRIMLLGIALGLLGTGAGVALLITSSAKSSTIPPLT